MNNTKKKYWVQNKLKDKIGDEKETKTTEPYTAACISRKNSSWYTPIKTLAKREKNRQNETKNNKSSTVHTERHNFYTYWHTRKEEKMSK